MLSEADIAEFKQLYKDKFDIVLDDQEARHKLSLLVRQMELVYQPITVRQLENLMIEEDSKDL